MLFLLLAKVIPMGVLVVLGMYIHQYAPYVRKNVVRGMLYGITPSMLCLAIAQMHFTPSLLLLPLLFFLLSSLLSLISWFLADKYIPEVKQITAFSGGTGNTGYFGIPISTALLGEWVLPYIVLMGLGCVIFENTLGVFYLSGQTFSLKKIARTLLTFPPCLGISIGFLLHMIPVVVALDFSVVLVVLKNLYFIGGMLLIGMGMSGLGLRIEKSSYIFFGITFFTKFILWPLSMFVMVIIDSSYMHLWTRDIHLMMVLLSAMPMAANVVSYALQFQIEIRNVATIVCYSIVFSILSILGWMWIFDQIF